MLSKASQIFRKSPLAKNFSTAVHTPICIIGAGTAGINLANQLALRNGVLKNQIRIFDPAQIHYYQPGWTMVGGGLIAPNKVVNYNAKLIPKGVNWTNVGISQIDPERNSLTTEDGSNWTYDHLIVAAGIQNNFDAIKGLQDSIEDPETPVASIYGHRSAQKWCRLMKEFKGQNAVFHQPPLPIKCPGAPQKILHLSYDEWKKKGLNPNISYYTAANVIFGVKKYAEILAEAANSKGIKVNFQHVLKEVRGKDRVAVFRNNAEERDVEVPFDVLHAVPPQRTPEFLRNNKTIANNDGYVEVDPGTLRSTRYPNVWAIGDCANLPTSKTAAAIMSEAPILIHNLLQVWREGDKAPEFQKYHGYTSCPLFVGNGKVLLAEFKYNGELDETFPLLQNKPRRLFHWFKKDLFPFAYYNLMPYGLWYGRNGIINPSDMYAKAHIKRVLETFPGVFSGIGEFSIHKEFVSSKVAGEVASLRNPALDSILDFAGEVGLAVLIHCDMDMPFAKAGTEPIYLTQMKEVLKRHPKTTIIWAHIGMGRVVHPVQHSGSEPISEHNPNQLKIVEDFLNDPALNHVVFDISWDEVAKYVVASPQSLQNAITIINRYPDRFLFGTDVVAPTSPEMYFAVYNMYAPLWKGLTPEASEKVRKGNYERIFNDARQKVRNWEKAHIQN